MDPTGVTRKSRLLSLATVREGSVTLEGETIFVREIGPLEFAEYGRILKEDRTKATAQLLAFCVIDGLDGPPLFESVDDALPIAKSARVSMPIINKVMQLSGFKDDTSGEEAEKEPDAS